MQWQNTYLEHLVDGQNGDAEVGYNRQLARQILVGEIPPVVLRYVCVRLLQELGPSLALFDLQTQQDIRKYPGASCARG